MESQLFFSQGDISNEYNLDFITQICSQDLEEFLIHPLSGIVDDCFNGSLFDGQVEVIPNLNVFPIGMVENKALGSARSVEEDDSDQNHGDSSGTTTRPRRDRAKTLVTERKRRGRMKERLYELRSLVPNITKMDKASIVSDAVGYVRDLQDQARKLEEEIAEIESSPRAGHVKASQLDHETHHSVCGGTILGVEAYEVGEGRFYVKVECSKRENAATSLYNAIESVECFQLEYSNFSMGADRYVLTLSLNVNGFGGETNASTVKFWMMGALLKEGFQLEMMMPGA